MRTVIPAFLCLAFLFAAASANPATSSSEGEMPAECALKDRGQEVVLLICDPEAADAAWRAAGQAACGAEALCNAWIWDSEANAPEVAPATDVGLGEQYSGTAVAVWVNDSQALITLRSAR